MQKAMSLGVARRCSSRCGASSTPAPARRRKRWRRSEELKRRPTYTLPLFLARVNAGLGHNDEAINWLEQAYNRPLGIDRLAEGRSVLESLRSEPRFKELVKRVGV